MAHIYKGTIKKLYIKGLKLNGEAINNLVLSSDFYNDLFENNDKVSYILAERIVSKDSLFYKNIFGNKVNMEFDNVLPDRAEAAEYINSGCCSDLLFVDYSELSYVMDMNRKDLKRMRKYLKR